MTTTTVAVAIVRPESRSMSIGYGIDRDTGEGLSFGLETRYAADIARALDAGEEVTVVLEPWMVVDRQKAVMS